MTTVFVGLGSNAGDRAGHLGRAVAGLSRMPGSRLTAVSSWYDTDPVGDPRLGRFLNGVARVDTELDPDSLRGQLLRLEEHGGRPAMGRGGERTIDLDLLYYGDRVLRLPGLEIPHPRVADRLFVLVPMIEVASDWVDPALGVSLAEVLRRRSNLSSVRWAGRPAW